MVDLCFMWNISFCHDVSHSSAIAGDVCRCTKRFVFLLDAVSFEFFQLGSNYVTLAATKSALCVLILC